MRWILLIGWLCIFNTAWAASAPAQDIAQWCSFDLPPMYIATGPKAGTGIVDTHAEFLRKRLPEYEHRILVSNILRVSEQIRAGEHVVCAGMQKNTERETYMLFSDPFYAATPPALLIRRSDLERLKPWLMGGNAIDLRNLLEHSDLALGIASGRSYGRDLDEILARFQNSPRLVTRTASQNLSEGLVQMMQLGRIDAALLFDSERRQLLARFPDANTDFTVLPIAGQPTLITVHIVAPRNPWGDTFIRRINVLLRRYWDDREFRAWFYAHESGKELEDSLSIIRQLKPGKQK